jgi:hypothetical protein
MENKDGGGGKESTGGFEAAGRATRKEMKREGSV